ELTRVAPDRRARIVKGLPGKDLSGLLAAPERADLTAVRDGTLFNYNMFAYIDGDFLNKAVAYMQQGGKPNELKSAGIRPDMMRRGAVRSVLAIEVFTRRRRQQPSKSLKKTQRWPSFARFESRGSTRTL